MTGRRVALAAALGLIAVGAVIVLEVIVPRARQRRLDARELLLPKEAPIESLAEIVLESEADRIALTPAGDGSWRVTSRVVPKDLVADRRAIELLHAALAGARVAHEVGGGKDVGDFAPFGLAPPHVTLSWRTTDGAARTLGLGNPTPDGRGTHALLDASRLVVVPPAIFEASRWDVGHFRKKELVRVAWEDLASLELVRTRGIPEGSWPRLVAAPDDHPAGDQAAWRIKEPLDAAASTERIASIASKAGSLASAGFGAEEPTEDDLKAAGLAPPAATLTMTDRSGVKVVLEVGEAGERENTAWARVDGGPLTMIRADLRDDLLLHHSFYRDARAFPLPRWALVNARLEKGRHGEVALELQSDPVRGWHAVQPFDADLPADRVRAFLDRLDDVAVGRFEDDREAAEKVFDFTGLGSFRLRGTAHLTDGRDVTTVVEVGSPFVVQRNPYVPIRTTDNAGRVAVTVTTAGAFDKALAAARELLSLAKAAAELRKGVAPGPSPDKPTEPPAPR